jgi:GMP synthase (glutamine-hydrolysing)
VRVLSVINERDAGTGIFADVVRERGHELDEWAIASEPPPGPPEDYDAVLVFGGAMHVDQEDEHPWLRDENALATRLLADETPLLAVCLGAQIVAKAAGAPVGPAAEPEIGWYDVELTREAAEDPIFAELPARFPAFQWHSYAFSLPRGAVPLARNDVCLQAYRLGRSAWGVQFHPEVTAEIVAGWVESVEREAGSPEVDLEETQRRIAGWNKIGRRICGGFLAAAEAATRPGATIRATSPRS